MAGEGKMRVSVAMCTWNGERFLAGQLASILEQTQLPDELVVCDDQSTDRTVSILRDFAAKAPFPVKINVNQRNLGYAANFAQAIGMCTGDLIALSDQDDIWYPRRLERSGQELADHPEAILVFSDANLIDENDQPLNETLWRRVGFTGRNKQDLLQGKFVVLARQRFVTGATVMFRTALRKYILPIPSGWIHDEWMGILAAAYGDLRPIDQPLIRYRLHGSQQVGFRNKLKQRTRGKFWARVAESGRELQEVCDALAAMDPQATPRVLPAYQQHLEFLRFRSSLPASPPKRLQPVMRHLADYGVHASGWKSALKDLVIPRPRS
jgi:glycosyltransferase involved in cell wall biosynthesis